MQPAVQVILSGALTFGVPLAFAARELIMLRRPGRGPGWRDEGPVRTPTPPVPGLAQGPKPLPACLIPQRQPLTVFTAQPRVLEPVDAG